MRPARYVQRWLSNPRLPLGSAAFLPLSSRRLSSTGPTASPTALAAHIEKPEEHFRGTTLPSLELSGEEEAFADEEFDELEAASQELHDVCYAMISFLRRADPDVSPHLFNRRMQHRFREPVPEHHRRMLHGHGDKSLRSRNSFGTAKEFEAATHLYLELGEKLLNLLSKPLMDRLLHSAGKGCRDMRSDGLHCHRRHLERASWRNFPHRWFKHAPFEVQQLRADIPEDAVANARCYRDNGTLRYLFSLIEPQHTYRERIERRMCDIISAYDPAVRQ